MADDRVRNAIKDQREPHRRLVLNRPNGESRRMVARVAKQKSGDPA